MMSDREKEILLKLRAAGARTPAFHTMFFDSDQSAVFTAMRYCPSSLAQELDLMERRGGRQLQARLELVRGVVEALASVHAAGVIHLDVKAENILLADSGDAGGSGREVLLTDFNLSFEAKGGRGEPRPEVSMSTFTDKNLVVQALSPGASQHLGVNLILNHVWGLIPLAGAGAGAGAA